MYTGSCLVLIVLTVVLQDGAIAWRIRLPRIRIPIPQCPTLCPTICDIYVQGGNPLCRVACSRICKRSITELTRAEKDYKVVPMSRDFRDYDLNNDKFISPEEFAKVQKVALDDAYKVFQFADSNGDGKLDADEFAAGPFMFEKEKTGKIGEYSGEN